MFEAIFDDFSVNLYKIDRDLKFLCFLPVCSHAHLSCMHVHTCAHAWGSPPTPTKNVKAQILLEAEIWHIMSLDAKLQIFVKVQGWWWGGLVPDPPPPTTTPKLQLDFKSKKSSCSLGVVVGGGLNITSTNSGTFYI